MAKISLRAYNHEIEEMIEHNQFDQAIAHCRNILKFFPKHINTYRLLGKSFLESQRYGDAGDIFQRILSSFPEDFVSHVGMSIIREDEGNLDDSLWHMERAFELQPSNNAIQGELRRLHGKLDGTEPAKIRLTRGALAHMYIRGDLLSQAIAELRIALTEDSSRFDLQVVLAKAYHQTSQLAEAAKISNAIIEKLPYCFEANRILADIYKKSDRTQEAETYQRRLIELEPYFEHTTNKAPLPEDVSDSVITLDKLDWKPDFVSPDMATQPEWAKSIGVSMQTTIPKDENIPDWLSTSEEQVVKTPQAEMPVIEIPEEESEIPSTWQMPESVSEEIEKDWETSPESTQIADDTLAQEEESQVFEEELETPIQDIGAEELEPADIPDWLQALAPKQTGNLEEKLVEDAVLTFNEEEVIPTSEKKKEKDFSWLDETPAEQEEKLSVAAEELEKPLGIPEEEKTELPEWLQEEKPAPADVEFRAPFEEVTQYEEEPVEAFVPKTPSEETDEFAWLADSEAEEIPEEVSSKESSLWLEETEEKPSITAIEGEELPPAEEVELPEWLAQMKEEAEKHPELVKPSETIPDWVKEIETPISEEDTKPTRISKQIAEEEPTILTDEPGGKVVAFDTTETEDFEETPLASILEEGEDQYKDQEHEIGSSAFTEAVEKEGQKGWLSELETQQQFEQSIFQEEKTETPPDWVTESLLEKETPVTEEKDEPATLEEVELPDWLAEMAPKDEAVEAVAEETPDWMNEYGSEISPGEGIEEPIPSESVVDTTPETFVEESPEKIDEVLSQESAEVKPFEEIQQAKDEEALPDWLLEYEEEKTTEPITEQESEQQPKSEVPAWFEQPEQETKLEIAFDEEPVKEESVSAIEPDFEAPQEEVSAIFKTPVSKIPEEELPIEETPASELFEEEIVEAETVVSEVPEEELPFEEAPVSELYEEEIVEAETVVSEVPEEELPIEEAPVSEVAEEEVIEAEAVVSEVPEEELPFEEAPVSELYEEEIVEAEAIISEVTEEELPFEEAPVSELYEEEIIEAEAVVSEVLKEELPFEETPASEVAEEEVVEAEAVISEVPEEELPFEEAPVSEIAEEEIIEAEVVVSEVPEEELPFEEAPVSEIAEEEIIEAEVVVSEVPEEELPFEEAPVSEIAEEEIIEAEAIVSEVPEEELPIEEAPVSEVAEEEVIEAEAVVLEVPEEELPIEEAPVSEIPEGEISEKEAPTVEIPVEQKLPLKAPVTRLLVEEMPMAEPEEKTELVVIDLNHASLVELERIPGVGFIKAQNIINYRNEHGSFESVDDLVKVSGFDVTLIDSIKSKLNVLAQAEEPAEISPEEEISTPLLKARNDLQLGKIPEAIDQYQELINTKTNLDEIAFDLQVAIDQYPTDTLLWQTLGDTCVRLGKLQDALNAYTQAEKLLR